MFLASCGEKKEQCEHSWILDEASSKSATCIENGYSKFFCSKCSEEKVETVESHGTEHKVVEDSDLDEKNTEEKNSAKCGAKYNVYGKCTYCHEILVLTENFKAEHKYNTYSVKYESIYDNNGDLNTQVHNKISGQACDVCGEFHSSAESTTEEHNSNLKNENSITNINKAQELGLCKYYENKCSCGYEFSIKVEHSWDKGEVLKSPTCTEKGIIKYTCSNADCLIKTKTEEIDPLGHKFSNAEKDMDCITRHCSQCDKDIAPTADHNYEYDFDCCDRVCTKCGYTVLATDNHQYKDNYTCHDRYCTTCNSPESLKHATIEHEFLATAHERLDCTDKEEHYTLNCLVCGDDVKKPFETSYNSHDMYLVDRKEPTCTENGYEIRGCTRCNYKETKELDALGHNYSGDVATCHNRTCIICGHVELYTTEHQLGADGTRCLICGEVIKLSKPIIYFDYDTNSLKVQGDATYIKYFLVTSETQRAAFNGDMSTYVSGVYSVCAKNMDDTGHYLESEESEILTVWVLKTNPIESAEKYTRNKIDYIKIYLTKNTSNIPYHLHIDYYDGDTLIGSKMYKDYESGDLITYTNINGSTATKIVITLMPPEELTDNFIYDGYYTFEYIIKE